MRARCVTVTLLTTLLGVSSALAQAPAASDSPDLAKTLDAYSGFRLAEGGRRLKGAELPIGRLTITVNDGTATPILAKDGTVTGLYFSGTGGWSYKPENATERAVIETNRKRVAPGVQVNKDVAFDTFNRFIVIFSQPLWKEQWDPSAGASEPPPGGTAAELDDTLKLVGKTQDALEFLLAQSRLNGAGRYVYAEFSGGAERVGYTLDEVFAVEEGLFGFRKLADYHARFEEPLANHTLGGASGDHTLTTSIRHADFDISTPDNKRGTIATSLELSVSGPKGAHVAAFHLANQMDPDSTDWDSKVNRLETKKVTDADGHALPFAHRHNILLVDLPPLAASPTTVKIRVETEGEVFLDWHGHHSDNFFGLSDWWYPQPANWRADRRMTFTVKVRVKQPWRPVTSGTETAFRSGTDWIETESRSDKPATHVAVLAAKYITTEATIDNRKIRVHAYSMVRKNVIENMPKLAAALIHFYSGILGPMESDELDIVEVPEYFIGESFYGVVLMPTEAFKPHEEVANLYVRGINEMLAHEIAHQWFGSKATPATNEDHWLSESLAEYWAGLAIGALVGETKNVKDFPAILAGWRGEAPNCEATGPIAGVDVLTGDQAWRDHYCLLYNRGPLVIHMLRTLVGNDRFNASCKTYLDNAKTGRATSDDFARAVTDTVRTDMSWVVDDWIRQGGTPDIKVDYRIADAQGGKHLTGAVTESGNGGFKRLYVPFIVDTGEVRLVFVDKPETAFDVPVAAGARGAKVDPGRNNLVKYH